MISIAKRTTSIAVGVFICAVMVLVAGPVLADDSPRLLWGHTGRLGVSNVVEDTHPLDDPKPDEKLGNGFDTIRGNGSPAGYMLSRGNIVSNTISVTIDGRSLVRNRDFFVDPVSGGLSFTEPVSRMQTIRATYRYREGGSVSRNVVGLPLLPSFFGGTGTSNFLHAYRAADQTRNGLPFDVLTFGMKMNHEFGNTNVESMLYISDPRTDSGTMSLLDANNARRSGNTASDQMHVQRATIDMGSSRLSVGYQDIGANFTGFATLREQGVLPAAEVNQYERERGVRRLAANLELQPSNLMPEGSPWNRFGWTRVYDSSGSMDTYQLEYRTPNAGVMAYMRTVDQSFRRLNSLSQGELSQLALQTRLQFDPNATVGQVSDNDRKAVVQETGLSRHLLNSYVKLNPELTGTLSFFNINDGRGDVARQILSLSGKSWQGWVANQTVSPTFGRLSALAPVEQAQFGNEYGMNKLEAGMSAKIESRLSLTSDYQRVSSDSGGVVRANMGLAGKYINFTTRYQSIDHDFTRIGDLADPQKKHMGPDRGFARWDMTFGGQMSPTVKLDTAFMRASNSVEDLGRKSDVLNLLFTPTDKTKFSLQHNHAVNRSAGSVLSGTMRDILGLEQRFNNNWFVSFNRDSNLTQAGGGVRAGSVTETYHFETDKSQPTWFSYDERNRDFMNEDYEYSKTYNVQSRIGNRLTVRGTQGSIDRGPKPSEDTTRLVMNWVATPGLNMGLDMHRKSTNYAGQGSGYIASLGGQVAERLGPFSNLHLTAEYGSTKLNDNIQTYTRGAKLDALWGKNVVGLEFSHILLPNGKRHMARGYRLKTDPDPEKWYRIDLYMMDKDAGWGVVHPIRNIAADVRLSPTTQLSYTVNQFKELPNGSVELSTSRSTKLTSRIANNLNIVFDYRKDRNYQAGTGVRKSNFGLQRQAAKGMVVDVYVGIDEARTPTGSVDGKSLRFKIDHQVSAERYLTFTGETTRWENTNPSIPNRTTAEGRLDYRMPISF